MNTLTKDITNTAETIEEMQSEKMRFVVNDLTPKNGWVHAYIVNAYVCKTDILSKLQRVANELFISDQLSPYGMQNVYLILDTFQKKYPEIVKSYTVEFVPGVCFGQRYDKKEMPEYLLVKDEFQFVLHDRSQNDRCNTYLVTAKSYDPDILAELQMNANDMCKQGTMDGYTLLNDYMKKNPTNLLWYKVENIPEICFGMSFEL